MRVSSTTKTVQSNCLWRRQGFDRSDLIEQSLVSGIEHFWKTLSIHWRPESFVDCWSNPVGQGQVSSQWSDLDRIALLLREERVSTLQDRRTHLQLHGILVVNSWVQPWDSFPTLSCFIRSHYPSSRTSAEEIEETPLLEIDKSPKMKSAQLRLSDKAPFERVCNPSLDSFSRQKPRMLPCFTTRELTEARRQNLTSSP